jgi:hypothetical protein
MRDKTSSFEKLYKEEKEQLEIALMGMLEDMEEIEARKEEKRWRSIAIDCCLAEALANLSKEDLMKISRNLQMKNVSVLKKQQLIERLAVGIPEMFSTLVTFIFDAERLKWFKKIVKNGGYLYNSKMPIEMVSYFRERGLLFTGLQQNIKIIVMPSEVLSAWEQLDDGQLPHLVRRNTEWVYLTQGLLYYYGALSFTRLKIMLEDLIGEELDSYVYSGVMAETIACYEQVRFTATGYCDDRVYDEEYVLAEQKLREHIPYYPFTREQLVKAGKPSYIEKSSELEEFIEFMRDSYDLSQVESNELAEECVEIINNGQGLSSIFEYLQANYEIDSMNFAEELANYLVVLHNQTRLWVLKGYKPDELARKEKAFLSPSLGGSIRKETPVFNIRTGEKVGRNDPCPCNSGRKFKKCCGK